MKNVFVVLCLCLALLMTSAGCDSGTEYAGLDPEMGVSALAALADGHIGEYVNSMRALVITPEVQSGEWENMADLLAKVEEAGTEATVWFVLPDGTYYTVEQGRTDENLSDRSYFPGLMAGDEVLGPLVISKTTGKASLIAAVPVEREGAVIGAVGCSIFLEDLSTKLAEEIALPDNIVFWATTQNGEVALHSDPGMILDEDTELPEADASKTSPLTNWQFALAYKE